MPGYTLYMLCVSLLWVLFSFSSPFSLSLPPCQTVDNSGVLEPDELRLLVEQWQQRSFTEDEFQTDYLQRIDDNNDGCVQFNEFLEYYSQWWVSEWRKRLLWLGCSQHDVWIESISCLLSSHTLCFSLCVVIVVVVGSDAESKQRMAAAMVEAASSSSPPPLPPTPPPPQQQ